MGDAIPYAEVIGDPIAHSKSPIIHEFWLKKTRRRGQYRRCAVTTGELDKYFAERRRDPLWVGCNITAPHKIAAVQQVDWLHPLADFDAVFEPGVGAINAVVRDSHGRLAGFNTDVAGVREALARLEPPPHSPHFGAVTYIIGAGGAARAAAVAVMGTPYERSFFYNRTLEKAQELSREFAGGSYSAFDLAELDHPVHPHGPQQTILIVNASRMGMAGQPPVPFDLTPLSRTCIVFDMVYEPLETPLLASAKALGMRVIDGLDMLIGQAAVAFELFFGAKAPREHDAELRELLTR
jgi:shikimate dehydrogenase